MKNQRHKIKNLSDLKDRESGIITKVKGYGAFRKRITEMGFVSGTRVTPIKKAPLQDPVEYELMGSRVSLRLGEAKLIEVVSEENGKNLQEKAYNGTYLSDDFQRTIKEKQKTIHTALVGNPNSGKTSLFNHATGKQERVGNYSGVTVDIKTAHLNQDGFRINLTDLPGTYSISEFTSEELFVRKHIMEKMPDVVINVVDVSNLERNLFLTTQLIDMNIKVVIALNMYDELTTKGDTFDCDMLGKMIGIPIIPTIASKGEGIEELIKKVIECYEENDPFSRHIHINYGEDINKAIDTIKIEIKKNNIINDKFHSRYAALKLLENDKRFIQEIEQIPETKKILEIAASEIEQLEKRYNMPAESIIADAKYAFIRGALKETYTASSKKDQFNKYKADNILTHRWLGFPIFFIILWAMFQITFSLGSYPMKWIEIGIETLGKWLSTIMGEGMLNDLFVDGIIGGVGGVIVFLPNILILFFCISLMEDTGYMARTAFIMDKLMHKIGLHGKSFIPLLMGFGCNVPAIMATRTLENKKDRVLTMLIIPFMSCSARLPLYVLLISAFFPNNQGLVLFSIYLIGVLLAVLMALLFKRIFFKKDDIPFVMELPPYRIPTLRNTTMHMWNKSVQYLSKMGKIILSASILIWALGYFPKEIHYSKDYDAQIAKIEQKQDVLESTKKQEINYLLLDQESEKMQKSYIGRIGHFITPILEPLGFDWKMGVSIITGLAAKEIIVSSMGILYQSDLKADETSVNLQTKLKRQTFTSGKKTGQKVFTPLTTYSFMLFVLIYFPCVAAIAAIKREAGWKWAVFTMIYTTTLAWMVSFIVHQTGSLFT